MIESCTLADTGMSQTTIIALALLIGIFGVGLFLLSRRYKLRGSFFAVAFILVATLSVSAQPAAAQTADCASNPTTDQPASGLQLVDDIQAGIPGDWVDVPVVANDLFPNGDPINWSTLDLIPETDQIDTTTAIYHPNNPSYQCGEASFDYDNTGENIVVFISEPNCFDQDSNTLALPSILYFQYTAQTQAGLKAPQPATVTITLSGVFAQDESIHIEIGDTDNGSVNVADSAIAVGSSINPDSVDLDPVTPGRQTSITLPSEPFPAVDVLIEVDSAGLVTVTVSDRGPLYCGNDRLLSFPYTIRDMGNTLSNEATITVTYSSWCT